jgi:hypothetical protein
MSCIIKIKGEYSRLDLSQRVSDTPQPPSSPAPPIAAVRHAVDLALKPAAAFLKLSIGDVSHASKVLQGLVP